LITSSLLQSHELKEEPIYAAGRLWQSIGCRNLVVREKRQSRLWMDEASGVALALKTGMTAFNRDLRKLLWCETF
jgi:hypothetical protein